MNDQLPLPDHWKKVTPPVDVGFQFDYYACRYCEAKVTNEFGPWVNNQREPTPRLDWKAEHELWCIVPIYLDSIGMGPR